MSIGRWVVLIIVAGIRTIEIGGRKRNETE